MSLFHRQFLLENYEVLKKYDKYAARAVSISLKVLELTSLDVRTNLHS